MADFPPLPTTSLATLCEMFPTMQRSVVEMILENAQGDGEKAIELLLGMADDQNLPAPVVEPEPSKTSLSYVSATLLSPRSSSASPVSNSPSAASEPKACTPPLSPLTVRQPSTLPPVPLADLQQGHLVFVILRGLPGSGKSSLATRLLSSAKLGVSLSTDDYFLKGGFYTFRADLLTEAHSWNQRRAMAAVKDRVRLVIIDNTNSMAWEMRPYIELALNNGYKIHILEPDTPWKFKPRILAGKNSHKVPKQKIELMLDRYEQNISLGKLKSMWNISEPYDDDDGASALGQEEEIFESEDEAINELLITPQFVVKVDTDGTVSKEQEDNLMGEEVEVVLRMKEEKGRRTAKFFTNSKEIIFCPGIVISEAFPTGVRIEVILVHVEAVSVVWVTPLVKVNGVEACMEMVDKISELLANQDHLIPVESPLPGQIAMARFSEDGLLYRGRVGEGGMVKFIDYGNGELIQDGLLYKMPKELKEFPAGAFKVNIELEAGVLNNEENIMKVEEILGSENISLVLEDGIVGTFYKGGEPVVFFEKEVREEEKEEKKVQVPKGCIIEISMSDEEEIEVSDGEEAKTEANLTVPVTVNHVENVFTVWVTQATSYSALDSLVAQLAEMEGKLTPLTNDVVVGDMVVARFTDDEHLYRAKVISINNKVATVLFIDFGDSELQPVDSFMELPVHFTDVEALAERVKLEGVEGMTDDEECREMVDKQLDKEGISMMMNDKGEASFWLNGEKIKFGDCESSSSGWKLGDKVAYRSASSVWRRGVIMMVGMNQDKVTIMGEDGIEMIVDVRHVKCAEMPLEALNMLEKDMIKSAHIHHGEPVYDGHHHAHGEGDKAPVQKVVPEKHLPIAIKLMDDDQDSPAPTVAENSHPSEERAASADQPGSPPVRSVFTPTASLTQQVVTDWIASCLHIINTREMAKYKEHKADSTVSGLGDSAVENEKVNKAEFKSSNTSQPNSASFTSLPISKHSVAPSSISDPTSLSPMEFLKYSETPSGSKRIQHLLSSGDEMVKARILQSVVLSDLMEMTSSPMSCQVVRKLLSCLDPDLRDQLAIPISKQFSDLALHPFGHQAVLALLVVGSEDQRDMLTYQLERENILLDLLKDKQGSFVVQRCLPYLRPQAVSSIVTSLESEVVEVGCHPHSSFFLQEFLRMFSGKDRVDILEEKVMDNLEMLVFNPVGHWVVQIVIKLGHPRHITMATTWMEKNIQEVMMDSTAVFVARTLVQQLLARSRKEVENTWSMAMDKIMWKMTDTMVMSKDVSLPLLIVAAMHHAGHIVVQEVVRHKDWLGHSKVKMMTVLKQNRLRLRVDTFGCLVVKVIEGWM